MALYLNFICSSLSLSLYLFTRSDFKLSNKVLHFCSQSFHLSFNYLSSRFVNICFFSLLCDFSYFWFRWTIGSRVWFSLLARWIWFGFLQSFLLVTCKSVIHHQESICGRNPSIPLFHSIWFWANGLALIFDINNIFTLSWIILGAHLCYYILFWSGSYFKWYLLW